MLLVEWLLTATALALGLSLLLLRERYATALMIAVLCAALGSAIAAASGRQPTRGPPIGEHREGFVTSKACRSCHPAQYASWHDSFHRSMTQPASLQTVASKELRRGGRLHLETNGRTVELFGRAGELWARLPDPTWTATTPATDYERAFRIVPMRDVPVRLLTGSHHHQAFWVSGERGELVAVPAVYLIDEQRLIPRRDAFLNPPEAPERTVRWGTNCIQCHAVAGQPGYQNHELATSAAELGIACEACHAQGAAHVRAMQNPLARYRAHGRPAEQLAIVNPAELTAERASQVCGRCHSYFYPKDENDWWQHGFARSFTPGQDLSGAQLLLSPETLAAPNAPQIDADTDSLFYRDGTIRVGGREYNGLVRSPCYERGHGDERLSCLSCHSLHQGAPDDQLDPEKLGNRACTQCHRQQVQALEAHTHHAASSAGSLCYNCHMPHVSYALLGAIRSHRIDSPRFDAASRDKPNACNLCHLEQSEAWAAERTRAWFGDEPRLRLERSVEGADDAPAGAVFALSGDAAVRAVTAAALGRTENKALDTALRAQLLRELERDDYAAVRAIAQRARVKLDKLPTTGAVLPDALLARLLAARDHHPVTIAE